MSQTKTSTTAGEQGWILRRPLQIESLRQELPNTEASERLLRRLQHHRENLDAVVYALSSRNLAPDRREHLVEMLRRYQRELASCFRELGVDVHGQGRAPLWYYNQLDPVARAHLAAILGVPEDPPFYEVLDIKAEEYLAQHSAFQAIADHYTFKERQSLSKSAKRSILVLTLSGSLIQLSEPISPKGARRYLYQNIYGNAHPPEGLLVLDRDIRVGHRLRSVELTTSPVRLLRIVGRKVSWKAQSQTFERISRTLSSLVSQSNSQLAAAGWNINPQTGLYRQTNLKAAERVLRQEYGEAFDRYREMRGRFVEESPEDEDAAAAARKVEAELLTLCHYLQTGARELGFEARSLDDLREFVTEADHLFRVNPERPGVLNMYPRGRGPEVVFVDVTVGRQSVTCRAPLALIGKDGGLVEVTLPVVKLRRR
jgi:hypothetical protein